MSSSSRWDCCPRASELYRPSKRLRLLERLAFERECPARRRESERDFEAWPAKATRAKSKHCVHSNRDRAAKASAAFRRAVPRTPAVRRLKRPRRSQRCRASAACLRRPFAIRRAAIVRAAATERARRARGRTKSHSQEILRAQKAARANRDGPLRREAGCPARTRQTVECRRKRAERRVCRRRRPALRFPSGIDG